MVVLQRRVQQLVPTFVGIAVLLTVYVPEVACVGVFYPYGFDEGDLALAKGEDDAVMVTLMNAPFRMYEKSHTKISVRNQKV